MKKKKKMKTYVLQACVVSIASTKLIKISYYDICVLYFQREHILDSLIFSVACSFLFIGSKINKRTTFLNHD